MLLLTLLALTNISATQSYPLDLFKPAVATAERAWGLWGWLWAPDAIVTVIDRDSPVAFASRPALFGAEIKEPVLGYVIPLSSFTYPCKTDDHHAYEFNDYLHIPTPNLGCPRLCALGPRVPSRSEPWIALVQRGNCSFAAKAREAQSWGAKAIVVGGNDPDESGHPDTLVSMVDSGETDDLNLTATYIKYVDYVHLSKLIDHSDTIHSGMRAVTLLITSEGPASGWLSPTLTFIAILLLPSILTFITLLIHRLRMVRAARRERAPEDIVRNLPWRVWTGTGWEKHAGAVPGESEPVTTPAAAATLPVDVQQHIVATGANEDQRPSTSVLPSRDGRADASEDEPAWAKTQYECAICLSEFAIGDRVRVLPCAHIFHMDEVDGWLINNKKLCPVCKADVTQPPATAADPEDPGARDTALPANENTPLLPRVSSDNAS